MGFLGFGKAKWRHQDAKVRLAGVSELGDHQVSTLVELALTDSDPAVRLAAAAKVREQAALQRLLSGGDEAVRALAQERLAAVAFKLVKDAPLAQCRTLLATISEQKSLAELSLSASDEAVRSAAFQRFCASPEPSQALLAMVAVQDASGNIAAQAVARISKRSLLKDIARKAKRPDIQAAAQQRADSLELEASKPSDEKRRKARLAALEPLCQRAYQLTLTTAWERVAGELADLARGWQAVTAQYPDLPADEPLVILAERFQRAQATFAERRQAAETEAQQIAGRLSARQAFLARLAGQPSWESEAIAEAERLRLGAEWSSLGEVPGDQRAILDRRFGDAVARLAPQSGYDGAGPVAAAATVQLSETERSELETISRDSEALSIREDWRDAAYGFTLLHKRWSQLTAGLAENDPLRQRFPIAYAEFKNRRRAWQDGRSAEQQASLAKLEALTIEAEKLAAAAPGEGGIKEFQGRIKQLQADWKALGPVRGDRALRSRFRAACDRAFAPLKQHHEAEDWKRFENMGQAKALIELVESYQGLDDLSLLARRIKDAHLAWKQVGPLPRDKQQETWLRFKAACDAQFERCKVFFAQQDEQRATNLEKKRSLLAEVEQLSDQGTIGLAGSPADLANKQQTAERIKAIQQEWKMIGPVPREHDQQMWNAFRALCDKFFAGHNAQRRSEQVENLQRKNALCAAVEDQAENAEAIAPGAVAGDRVRWLRQVRDFQAEWKTIGHVPMEDKETVWDRFRIACDRIYALTREPVPAPSAVAAAEPAVAVTTVDVAPEAAAKVEQP